MNTRRIFFWVAFIIILALIIWGLIVAMNRPVPSGPNLGTPAPVTALDHVTGPADAPVTMIEYSDFQCPACELYHPLIEKVLASSTIPIRFIYRHFPLSQHANAMPAALASEAAGVQGKFWDMYHLLFNNHEEWTELPDAKPIFIKYASDIGLDVEQFKTDLSSSTLKDRIVADSDGGIKIGIDSTPTFFLNDRAITNPKSYDEFISDIQKAASRGSN